MWSVLALETAGFKEWNAVKSPFPLSTLLLSMGYSFSLKHINLFHMAGNIDPEIDISVTPSKPPFPLKKKKKRSSCR